MPDLFAASRVKVDRAKQFIHELQIELDSYTNRDPNTARLKGDNTTTDISADEMSLVPGAIIGDAVHNLRTALDLMASELARLNKRNAKTVYFPFATSAYEYDAAITRNDFRKCGEDAVYLLKTFKPYRGGNERLRAIHDLDMQDKHTALVPTRRDMSVTIDTQHQLDSPEAGPAAIIGKDITYAFPEGGIMGGRDIIETLKEFVEIVDGILEAFAQMVELRAATPDRAG